VAWLLRLLLDLRRQLQPTGAAQPGVPLSEVLRAQRRLLSPAMGATPALIRRTEALTDHVNAAIRNARDDADAEARALKVIKAEAGDLISQPGQAEMMAKQMASGWMRTLVDYDPRPTLAKLIAKMAVARVQDTVKALINQVSTERSSDPTKLNTQMAALSHALGH
jgi:hypothetical protein